MKTDQTIPAGSPRPVPLPLILLLALLCLAPPRPARAVGNLRVGAFGVHPSLALGVLFSDNLLRTNADAESDTGFLITPGITIENEREDRKLRLEYHSLIEEYLDIDSQNAVNHFVEGLGHFELASGWTLEGLGRYRYDHDPQGTNIGEALDFFKEGLLQGGASYTFADLYRVSADLRYLATDYKGDRNAFRDRDELRVTGTFFYQFLPRTSALVEGSWGETSFDTGRTFDNDTLRVLAGLTWEITGKTTGTVKLGFASKDFEDPAEKDFSGFVFGAEADYEMDEWTRFSLEGLRDVNETNMASSNYYTTTGVALGAHHLFTEKIGADLGLSWGLDEYSNPVTIGGVTDTREDETWTLRLGGRYALQEWLRVQLRYEFRSRSSNFDSLSYDENRVLFEVSSVL